MVEPTAPMMNAVTRHGARETRILSMFCMVFYIQQ
jgi:hypothetical protein